MTPKWHRTKVKDQSPYVFYQVVSLSPNFYQVSLFDKSLSSHMPLSFKCTEWPQMTKSQISPRFALWPNVFEIQDILWRVHWKNNNKETKLHVCCATYVTEFPHSNPFRAMASCFRVTGYFQTSALDDLKVTLSTTRWRGPIYALLELPSPKFHSICAWYWKILVWPVHAEKI